MQEFITAAASRFGLGEDQTTQLTGGVLSALQSQGGVLDGIKDKIPGLSDMLAKAPAAAAAPAPQSSGGLGGLAGGLGGLAGGLGGALSGGLSGGLATAAASALGGDTLGQITGLASKFGLSPSSATQYVQMLLEFIKNKAGDQALQGIASKVPALRPLLAGLGA